MSSFMISFKPAQILVTRASRQARATRYFFYARSGVPVKEATHRCAERLVVCVEDRATHAVDLTFPRQRSQYGSPRQPAGGVGTPSTR